MTITDAQAWTAVNTGAITGAVTTLGSLLVLGFGSDGPTDTVSTINGVSSGTLDSFGNRWTKAISSNFGAGYGNTELWYCRNSQPITTVTPAWSGATNNHVMWLMEFGGVAAQASNLDRTASSHAADTSPTVTTSATVEASEVVIGMCSMVGSAFTPSLSVGAGYLNGQFGSSGTQVFAYMEWKLVSSTGAQTATFSGTGTTSPHWQMVVATFVAAPSAIAVGMPNNFQTVKATGGMSSSGAVR